MNAHAQGSGLRRREEILRIVRETTVRSQEDLQRILRRRGFPVTQPTLSRDLRTLGLAKSPSGYLSPGEIPEAPGAEEISDRLDRILRDTVLSVETAGNLLVLRTPPAAADAVALALDRAGLPGALGTIAGDDTIFLAARTADDAAALRRRLRSPLRSPRIRRVRA